MSENRIETLPGNPRYQPKSLMPIFGYDNLYLGVGEVELATLDTLGEIGIISSADMNLLNTGARMLILDIRTTDVDLVEKETKHDMRAWVQLAQKRLTPSLGRYLHVPLTSYDGLDSGRILLYKRAYKQVIKPLFERVVTQFIALVRRAAAIKQIGRTHGQHALPVTVGFWAACILDRLVTNIEVVSRCADALVGKISGATGAYNGQVGLGFEERCKGVTFEELVLEKVGLEPAPISTQILPPEPLAYFLNSIVMCSGVLGQFGRDCRNLMRTEIGEIGEDFKPGQVGSSTMAHKRNPITFESLEGMFIRSKNEIGKVWDTLISDHQRDLVGSAVMRDFPIMLVNLVVQLENLLRVDDKKKTFLERMKINEAACTRNLETQANVILAEPLYIALQLGGYEGDAHHLVNHTLVPAALNEKKLLIEVCEAHAQTDEDVHRALCNVTPSILELLHRPAEYIGKSVNRANEVADSAERRMEQI